MKKLLLGLLTLASISAFGSTEIARITERNSNRELVYSQEGSQLIFTLVTSRSEREIKRLDVNVTGDDLTIVGDKDAYRMRFFKTMKEASRNAYVWCFKSRGSIAPMWSGGSILLVPITLPLCATLPGVPFIIGAIVAPFDGVITLADTLFDTEEIAARKFSKLLRGKNKNASKEVFQSLVQQIREL